MTRLGLWGPGTQYPEQTAFMDMMNNGAFGMTAMELVAMELKRTGSLVARTLAYDGVEFQDHHHAVDDDFRRMYDASAKLWRDIINVFDTIQEGIERRNAKRAMFGTMQRFFKQLTTAAKVPAVLRIAKESLEAGQAVVIGLQSTGEARTEAAVQGQASDDGDEFDAFVQPASLMIRALVEKWLVVEGVEPDAKVKGILDRADALALPPNPLDDIIHQLGGPKKVAEMTGRKRRMVKGANGAVKVRALACV